MAGAGDSSVCGVSCRSLSVVGWSSVGSWYAWCRLAVCRLAGGLLSGLLAVSLVNGVVAFTSRAPPS